MRVLKSSRITEAPVLTVESTPDPLASFIGTKDVRDKALKAAKQRKKAPTPKEKRTQLLEDCRARMRTKNWEGASASTLVALYYCCHELVYGTPPEELNLGTHWKRATMMAGSLIKNQFNGDTLTAIKWMRWIWSREQTRLEWRKKQNREGTRLSYLSLFGWLGHVSDWRARQQTA